MRGLSRRAKDNAHFDAYFFNTRTGEAFFVQERTKTSGGPQALNET